MEKGTKLVVSASTLSGIPVAGAEDIVYGWIDVVTGDSKEPVADVLGMGRLGDYGDYSYSDAVKEMGRRMYFSKDDQFIANPVKIREYAKTLHDRGIDPESVLKTAYMEEVKLRFRRKYGNIDTIEKLQKTYIEKGEQMSEGDFTKLEKMYDDFASSQGEPEMMENLMTEFVNIIEKSGIQSKKGYAPKGK